MISLLALAFVCVAGLHLATALFVAMHHARRPRDAEFLPLSGICFSQALCAIGTAIVADASHAGESVVGQQMQMIGAALSLGAYSVLAPRITDAPLGHAPRMIQVWMVVFIGALLGGLCFADAPRAARTLGFAWAPDYQEAQYTTLGLVLTWGVLPVAVFVVHRVNQQAPIRVGRVELWFSLCASALAFWNDTLVRFGPLRSIYLTEIAMLVMALNANRRLRTRFQTSTDELAVRTAELDLSMLELEQMHAQLVRRQQLAAVGEFSAVIAHEVRNPLAIIKNAVAALRRGLEAGVDPELLAIVDEEVTRLQRLVSDLSTYTRPIVPRQLATPLSPLVQQVVARARTANQAINALTVCIALDPEVQDVFGDPDLIEMALTNVLANATQATAEGGTITIEAHRYDDAGRGVELCVVDTGAGMPPEVAAKAKEAFFTTRSTGTGLGLAIVDRVMRAHGGEFRITSTNAGTRIALRFPERDSNAPHAPLA